MKIINNEQLNGFEIVIETIPTDSMHTTTEIATAEQLGKIVESIIADHFTGNSHQTIALKIKTVNAIYAVEETIFRLGNIKPEETNNSRNYWIETNS